MLLFILKHSTLFDCLPSCQCFSQTLFLGIGHQTIVNPLFFPQTIDLVKPRSTFGGMDKTSDSTQNLSCPIVSHVWDA
ncbi:hypothetical protein SLEP1_g23487 [Rubroshorea leprosula]|uniref:Uncharacterized protein n=1 Tax=Rubroshorea leprosula TaxID=152421 RepID=A0AAV5JNH8_9ROSI|nr:hypothetical protein SLEP1_g23487 [Rubroshorea leprosula]